MDQRNNNKKVPPQLSLTAYLSSGLTLVVTVTYTVLCILALVYRFQCDSGTTTTGSSFFMDTIYKVYIQKDSCEDPESPTTIGVELMSADTLFIFAIVTLIVSVFSCAAAIVLIYVVADKTKGRFIFAASWVHICICFSGLVVDLTLAVFFGLDYGNLSNLMNISLPGIVINYRLEVLRQGALLFMTVALKGYLAHTLNAVLLILLIVFATRYRSALQHDEHSIHKMGALNAYELQKREDAWQQQQEAELPFSRGRQQLNPGFVPDEEPRRSPRSPVRTVPLTPLSDYSNNRDYDRSDSWHHNGGNARPFSYMEEPRRQPRPVPAPVEPQWRRDPWPPAPPVPAPDYSPPSRRLKSALKPNYM
ncbi:uncharacterized protein [Choristoneura fumiferana]|uniref:uncharacterized protein n=1 Tax=Choristoneura fumiferana TaxID=7141 RepID=UPI003D15EC00